MTVLSRVFGGVERWFQSHQGIGAVAAIAAQFAGFYFLVVYVIGVPEPKPIPGSDPGTVFQQSYCEALFYADPSPDLRNVSDTDFNFCDPILKEYYSRHGEIE